MTAHPARQPLARWRRRPLRGRRAPSCWSHATLANGGRLRYCVVYDTPHSSDWRKSNVAIHDETAPVEHIEADSMTPPPALDAGQAPHEKSRMSSIPRFFFPRKRTPFTCGERIRRGRVAARLDSVILFGDEFSRLVEQICAFACMYTASWSYCSCSIANTWLDVWIRRFWTVPGVETRDEAPSTEDRHRRSGSHA
jgi:hypothetical protein